MTHILCFVRSVRFSLFVSLLVLLAGQTARAESSCTASCACGSLAPGVTVSCTAGGDRTQDCQGWVDDVEAAAENRNRCGGVRCREGRNGETWRYTSCTLGRRSNERAEPPPQDPAPDERNAKGK